MNAKIPTEFYVAFLDRTFEVHWDLHAYLMFGVWFVLVPFGILSIRYLKNRPSAAGLPRGTSKLDLIFLWWGLHIWSLYAAISLSMLGVAIAIVASGGFSGSMHSIFGFATVLFGLLQVFAAWGRGSHGGQNHLDSAPDDPTTWRGDHYDMTTRRRWFEAYHKPGGYFGIFLALGAVTSGLIQFWMPLIAIALVIILLGGFVLIIMAEGKGLHHDTYRAVFGTRPDHPFNKMRKDL